MEDAIKYYQLDTTLLISVTVRNQYELDLLEKSGIPSRNVVAFTGLTEPAPALYQALHRKGISCVLATLGNLDKKAVARKSNVYLKLIQNGADIIATDRPREAYQAINRLSKNK
jgi:glycerophosphoryl diester phosphodiesterase